MTEEEWLRCNWPADLLRHLESVRSPRKARLVVAASLMIQAADLLAAEELSQLLESAADGLLSRRSLHECRARLTTGKWVRLPEQWQSESRHLSETVAKSVGYVLGVNATHEAQASLNKLNELDRTLGYLKSGRTDGEWPYSHRLSSNQAILIRDIFGNPFRPVAFDPAWRTSTAVTLARGMYDARDFAAMPILADALQDAGCEHADVLDHCRGPGPHVRGCWVVDHVLGKQ